ncbi:MAG TPA: PIG-L family deacetylase, partial [Candidatus Polarisedimenticolaceae bacterium]|nr:PIG-L family deacetylase [Candidatus Polarisedimenticolaceae bacterium]
MKITETPLLQEIMAGGKPCYFISPHYDDMAFSAGALATHLKPTNPIVAINVFTKAAKRPYTLSTKAYLRQCGYTDTEQLYADREAEDKQALAALADKIINLGFTEALGRRSYGKSPRGLGKIIPELAHAYPIYRFHITKGKVARSDAHTVTELEKKLAELIDPQAMVFCPLGVGGHIDHVITRLACDKLFPQPIHWSDYPYNLTADSSALTGGMQSLSFDAHRPEKTALITAYKSQYNAIFGQGLNLTSE